jgi:uncharacterized protein (DUF1800 family)
MLPPPTPATTARRTTWRRWLAPLAAALWLSGCGGGGGAGDAGSGSPAVPAAAPAPAPAQRLSDRDAVRLADQASFGASEALLAELRERSAAEWIAAQMALPASRYRSGGGDELHRGVTPVPFCERPERAGPTCVRDHLSTQPLLWDFYRNALEQPDQLRQRVAFALQQVVVVSGLEVSGTYGHRRHHNLLLDHAFGNWRDLLRAVTLSPVMGEYLDLVNNQAAAPNENYARELLHLFSIGRCRLRRDGLPAGERCEPVADNAQIRAYARALTGWTYPPGGSATTPCLPLGSRCPYLGADMVPAPSMHDSSPLTLLSGVQLAAGHDAPQALEAVLDSLMAHPNVGPFVARRLIQHLVTSNPTAGYVDRVATAFERGRLERDGHRFGSGRRGDLAATVAAILLDDEARGGAPATAPGRLREPVLVFTGALRAFGGRSDGEPMAWWLGQELHQMVFNPPSVFSFYSPEMRLAGSALEAGAFGIHHSSAAVQRLNLLGLLFDWGGVPADGSVPGAVGTAVDVGAFSADADQPGRLVDRLSRLLHGQPLPDAARAAVVAAVAAWTPEVAPGDWRARRVQAAAYLLLAAPAWQVIR